MIGDVLQAKFGNFGVVGQVGHRLKFGNEAKKSAFLVKSTFTCFLHWVLHTAV